MPTAMQREKNLRDYVKNLDEGEKTRYLNTTIEQFMAANQGLLVSRAKCKRTVHFCTHIEPIVHFIQRYSKAVDVMVQQTSPVALVWGSLRFVTEAIESFTAYFSCLSSTLQQIGDKLQSFRQFEEIHSDWQPFRQSLTDVYYHVLIFLFQVNRVFRARPHRIFGKAVLKTFDREFHDSLSSISRYSALLLDQIKFAHHRTAHMERRRRLMGWLAPVSLDNDLVRWWSRTTQGTHRWFLDSKLYTDWRDEDGTQSVLWISGSAGIGKTFLAASVVQDLQRRLSQIDDVGLGYFFFDSSDNRKSTLLEAVATLTAQLVSDRERLPPDVLDIYERATRYGRSRISSLDKPVDIIAKLLKGYRKVYLVLDGIDESSETAMTLREILALACASNVRLLFASRDTLDTRSALSTYATLKLMPALVRDDINVFLRQELSHLAVYFEQEDLVDLTFDRLCSAADGSFLWAHLMMQTLRKAPNVEEFLSMTRQLPTDLESIYRNTLQALESEPTSIQDLARNLLCWVCFAMRPLRWRELQHALCFDPDTEAHRHDRMPFKNSVLRLCNPLLEYDSGSDEFRPVHWSVCEFLAGEDLATSRLHNVRIFQNSHSLMLHVCLSSLRDPSVAGTLQVQHDRSPLVEYATLHWCDHLFQAQPSTTLNEFLGKFILTSSYRRTWIARYMLLQIAAFPLQAMLAQLRRIHAWLNKEPNNSSEIVFDVLEDMFHTILVLADQAQGTPQPTSCFAHFERMMVVRDLARAYTLAGRISDGLQWLQGAVERARGPFDRLSIENVWLLNSLGIMYDQQKEFSKSVNIQLEALTIQRSELPPDHLDIVWTINELGRIYRHLELLTDAEKMHTQALGILTVQFKESDPQIVWTRSTLARTYRFQGRFADALTMHKQVLVAQIESVGESHCHTLWTKSDIARCLRDQGKLLKALQLLQEVVEGRTKTLGETHADTLWSVNDVGLVLAQLGRKVEAKTIHEKALRGQILSLGKNHEQTMWTWKLLASWND